MISAQICQERFLGSYFDVNQCMFLRVVSKLAGIEGENRETEILPWVDVPVNRVRFT